MNIGTIIEFLESMVKSTTMSRNDGAYGGGMAGAPFDPIGFIKKPQVILRIVGIVFSIIVFASIASEDMYQKGTCPMDKDSNACGFGITIGVIGFLGCLIFLIIDARFDSFSSVKIRKRAVILDMIFSGVWGFVWFIGFCYMTNAWRKADDELVDQSEAGLIRLALAFSFFSILIWVMICLLNYLRYRQGVSNIFNEGYEDPGQNLNPAGVGQDSISNENFRQAPFTSNLNNNGGYQQNY